VMRFKWPTIVIAVVAALAAGGFGLYRWWYPYGYTHSCSHCLMIALFGYADEHEGRFPAGETTPEACLSLLYPKHADASVLRGKTVPLETVKQILARGEPLGPDTCGWHYVEGLTKRDHPRLAIVGDKVGLGHFGNRLGGGHEVILLGGGCHIITAEEWPGFLEEQRMLLAARNGNAAVK